MNESIVVMADTGAHLLLGCLLLVLVGVWRLLEVLAERRYARARAEWDALVMVALARAGWHL